jgi:hypothetical protein
MSDAAAKCRFWEKKQAPEGRANSPEKRHGPAYQVKNGTDDQAKTSFFAYDSFKMRNRTQ